MTNNEDFGREMNFMLKKAGEAVSRLHNVINTGFTDVNAKINMLVDAQIRSEERLTCNEEKTAHLQGKRTGVEESIKRLSDTVDRYIRDRRNGQ